MISPIADDLAVVYLPLLPVGLWALLRELGIRLIEVPDEELPTLGANVLAARGRHRGRGQSADQAALEAAGCEVRLPGHGDRHQRLRRPDVPHSTDPSLGVTDAERSWCSPRPNESLDEERRVSTDSTSRTGRSPLPNEREGWMPVGWVQADLFG